MADVIEIAHETLDEFFRGLATSPKCCRGSREQWYKLWPAGDVLGAHYLMQYLLRHDVRCEIRDGHLWGFGDCRNLQQVTGVYLKEYRRVNS